MTSTGDLAEAGGADLVSAIEVIEAQPLAQRAPGYAALHDELARRLDGAGTPEASRADAARADAARAEAAGP